MDLEVTFSVIDAAKASELYDAYVALCEKQLISAADDIGVLAEMSRCGSRATRYAEDYYDVYNTADLGNYAALLADSFPEESSRIRDLVGESVLYHRENGALNDSTGISVYLPTEVKDLYGLLYYLDYIYNVSDNDTITALYYYKQAGVILGQLQHSAGIQLDMFVSNQAEDASRQKRLMHAIDQINNKFGTNQIHYAIQGHDAQDEQMAGFMRPHRIEDDETDD